MLKSFDSLPTLDIKHLRNAGLFTRPGRAVTIRHRITMVVTLNRNNNRLQIHCNSNNNSWYTAVKIKGVSNNIGERVYLVCPRRAVSVEKLYLWQGQFLSRQAVPSMSARNGSPSQRNFLKSHRLVQRLQGLDGRGPARGKNRRIILAELKNDPLALVHHPEIAAELNKLRQTDCRKLVRQESSIKAGPFSTRNGLQCVKETPSEIMARGIPELEVATMPEVTVEPGSIWLWPAIDLPTLLGEMKKTGAQLETFHMVWASADPLIVAEITVDIRYRYEWGLRIRILDGFVGPVLAARIVSGSNGRYRLTCPVSGKRLDTLYLRSGVLAGPKALRLQYPAYAREQKRLRTRVQAVAAAASRQRAVWQAEDEAKRKVWIKKFDLQVKIGTALVTRALAGHVPSAIRWLKNYGGPEWQEEGFSYPEIVS